jgi:hypothetical protein
MSITLSALQKQRRDTAANWTTANPTLLAGEIGIESDTSKWKVGDGTTAWNSLAYVPAFSISAYPLVNADISATAEIAVSKLADGTARQLLQTDAAGTGVEWASNIDVPGTLDVTGAATFDAGVTIQGDLTVNGTTTTIDTQNLIVEDKNVVIGQVTTPTDVTADGGGITLKGSTDKTINWVDATDAWTFSEHVNLASGKGYYINGTQVLSSSTLGSGVTGSSLTSVGTIGTGVWQGTAINKTYLDSTLVSTGDTGTVTSTMIADGTIVNGDINASAAIAGTKISPNFGSQTVTTTGVISAALGSASTPSITFTGDLNTGIYSPGADQVAISTGGTGRLFVDSSGRVGLGTSTPGSILTAKGPIASTSDWGNLGITSEFAINSANRIYNGLYFLDSGTSGSAGIGFSYDGTGYKLHIGTASSISSGISTALTVDRSQRVGIGTTSPQAPLHVSPASGDGYINVTSVTSSSSVIFNDSGTGGNYPKVGSEGTRLVLRGGSVSNAAYIDSSGRLLVGTSTSTNNVRLGEKLAVVTTGGSDYGGASLTTYAGSTAALSPLLEFQRSRGTTDGSMSAVGNGDSLGQIIFRGATGSAFESAANITAEVDGAVSGAGDIPGRLVFSTTADGASSPTEAARITSGQRFLVNTTTVNPHSSGTYGVDISAGTGVLVGVNNVHAAIFARWNGDGECVRLMRNATTVGTISVTTTATAYNTSSDYRLKENVVPLTGAINRLNQLQVHRFNFISDPDKTVDGFLAHEAQAIVPECATGTKDEVDADGNPVYQGIDQSKLVPLLTAALQEALAEIESLKARVTALEP